MLSYLLTRIESLTEEVAQLKLLEHRVDALNEKQSTTVIRNEPTIKSDFVARTCHELRDSDPNLSSGMYYVDPDGPNVGENPIYVYCNMVTGILFNFFWVKDKIF